MSQGKPKVLVAGGSHADIPQIRAAQALGYHVISSGNRPGDLGHQVADSTILADFSDFEAMLAIARQEQVAGVCAGCNDFAALSAAYVAEQLALPGHDSLDTARLLHHKDSYREFVQANNLPSPRAQGFDDPDKAIGNLDRFAFPVIVKPVDLTGGKGIATAENKPAAVEAIRQAFAISRSKRIVVEEFLVGSRHGLTTLLRDGKVVFSFDDNEHYFFNQYLVSGASTPGDTPRAAIANLHQQAETIAGLLALCDGILHIQFILTTSGDPVIIEICRRPPGDLYTRFVQLATGTDYPRQIVRGALGLGLEPLPASAEPSFMTRHCIMATRNGRVREVQIDDSIRSRIIEDMYWWQPGESIENFLAWKAGIIFIRYHDAEEYHRLAPQLSDLVQVIVD